MLSDSQIATGIYEDADGDSATEGELIAWWDGSNWRYGNDRDFAVVPDSQLAEWARRPLSEDQILAGPRYETAPIDDVAGLNVDTFIYIGGDFDPETHPTLTVRYTPSTVAANTIAGTEDPPWTLEGNEAPTLDTYTLTSLFGSGSDDDDFLGCSYNPRSSFDPTLLLLLGLTLAGLTRRHLRGQGGRE